MKGAFLAAGVRPRGSGLSRARSGSWQRCRPHCHSKLWAPRPRLENRFRHVALWLMAASGGHSGALGQASSGHRSRKTTTGPGFYKQNEHCTDQRSHDLFALALASKTEHFIGCDVVSLLASQI